MGRLDKDFRHPNQDYRCAPFWSWNDRLTDEELLWQIDQMKSAGMGGFFMHSRAGLITPFLGEEWMARVRACVAHAKEVGMNAWLYDEDRWPSGAAGGLVTGPHPEHQMRPLARLEVPPGDPLPEDGDRVAVFACADAGASGAREFADVTADPGAAIGRRRVVFYVPAPRPSTWYNNTAYLDTLSIDAVRQFIETAYAAYEPAVGEEFGRTVPGVFTDEPNYLNVRGVRPGEAFVPWTPGLPDLFRARHGYDLLPVLPSLFYPVGDWRKVRHDFYQTAAERFVEAYSKQIGGWCGAHGLQFTGHVLWEESLDGQTAVAGAAMPHYEYMQAPGVDILRERIAENLTLKQCTSVAHQFGQKWVLSELYGVTGWQFTFEGMKWIGDWHAVLGVNLRCPHLTLYSLRGCRKRDYPPSFNYQSPWWGDYRLVADHYARLQRALTEGAFVADTLLLHAIGSAWCLYTPHDRAAARELSDTFTDLVKTLLDLKVNYDLGDESLLARHAKVDGQRLKVRKMAYRVVVVPPMPSIEPKTLALLKKFVAAKGRVIALRPTPTWAAGAESEDVKTFFADKGVTCIPNTPAALAKALDRAGAVRVSITDPRGRAVPPVWVHQRQSGARHIFFFANTDRQKGYDAVVRLPVVGRVEVWDTETGEIQPLPVKALRKTVEFRHRFAPVGALLVVVDTSGKPVRAPARRATSAAARRIRLAGPWAFARSAPNALTLDTCAYSLHDGPWSDPVPVWRASEDILKHFGLASNRGNSGVQYWKLYPAAPRLGSEGKFALRFTFQVDSVPAEPVQLVLEAAERFAITLNGAAIDNAPVGWYVDKAFSIVNLGGALKAGENVLQLSAIMQQDLELENVYLIGSFAVDRATRAIRAAEPAALELGDWCDQGYPYFAGTMTYRQRVKAPDLKGRRAVLELGTFSAALVRVRVNGADCGKRGWAPYAVDVTRALRPGENDVEIDLVATNRNLLGPHHFKVDGPAWVGPSEFSDEKHWAPEYLLWPYGLFEAPRIAIQ
jgi:hypothetical protein